MEFARPLAKENFDFGELKYLTSGRFLVQIYKYLWFLGLTLHASLPKKILLLVSLKCLISGPVLV